jgi:hypothetical protein
MFMVAQCNIASEFYSPRSAKYSKVASVMIIININEKIAISAAALFLRAIIITSTDICEHF